MHVTRLFDLSGRVAVVTGAGKGLGLAIAETMAEAGADVVCADIDAAANEACAAKIRTLGRQALALPCDVTQEADVVALFEAAEQAFGHVDIAFANAGIADGPKLLHELSTERWNRVLAVNLQGVFFTDREALKIMVRQRRGKIVNVASMFGLAAAAGVMPIPAYSASKGAVVNLTRELALQYAPMNIQVNALCPGFVRTAVAGGVYDNPRFVEAVTAFTPMGRVAEVHEIQGAALYLASDASSFTTGAALVVDGGCMAR